MSVCQLISVGVVKQWRGNGFLSWCGFCLRVSVFAWLLYLCFGLFLFRLCLCVSVFVSSLSLFVSSSLFSVLVWSLCQFFSVFQLFIFVCVFLFYELCL